MIRWAGHVLPIGEIHSKFRMENFKKKDHLGDTDLDESVTWI
jgi:hypothetical protein